MERLRHNLLAALLVLALSPSASAAEITTKEQADAFLENYCIALVNQVAEASKRQAALAAREDWEGFVEQGAYIAGIAEVYNNLCKERD